MTNYLDSYKSIFLDISLSDFWKVFSLIRNEKCLASSDQLTTNLIQFWSKYNSSEHFYLPLLCVRTGFDLFLRVNQFPPQSEIIMSAVNIPSMITLVQCHQLTVVPCDIDLETISIDVVRVKRLLTSRTVAIVFAHIYGRCVDVSALVDLAYEHQVYFIEDCAESFAGFCSCSTTTTTTTSQSSISPVLDVYCPSRNPSTNLPQCYMGHPRSHLVLFSFGVLKFCTALGGGMAKFADIDLYHKMHELYLHDPIQQTEQYRINVRKYFSLYWLLNVPYVIKPLMYFVRLFRLNHMEYVVEQLRAFSKLQTTEQLFLSLRRRPCRSLLAFLDYRFQSYDYSRMATQRYKAMYVIEQLSSNKSLQFIGMKSTVRNFWLFPIVVQKPDLFVRLLSKCHIDAYRGTTQLNVVTKQLIDTDNNVPISIDDHHKCPNAEYLIEHVIYLPVHCHVPDRVLTKLITIVHRTAKQIEQYSIRAKL